MEALEIALKEVEYFKQELAKKDITITHMQRVIDLQEKFINGIPEMINKLDLSLANEVTA